MITFSELSFIDLGSTTKPGTSKIENNELLVEAGGKDIWEKHDEFRFGYKKLKGDFDLSVQILELYQTNLYTKAGIMARAELSDSSKHVFFQVFPDNSQRNNNKGGCEFQYRADKAIDMKAIYPNPETAGTKFNVDFPKSWIRLVRKGNEYKSYFSHDNKNWELYCSFTLELPDELYVGMAVTAHDSNQLTHAKFSSLLLN